MFSHLMHFLWFTAVSPVPCTVPAWCCFMTERMVKLRYGEYSFPKDCTPSTFQIGIQAQLCLSLEPEAEQPQVNGIK